MIVKEMTTGEFLVVVRELSDIFTDASLLQSAHEASGGKRSYYWLIERGKMLEKAKECLDKVSDSNLEFVVDVLRNQRQFPWFVYGFLSTYIESRSIVYG